MAFFLFVLFNFAQVDTLYLNRDSGIDYTFVTPRFIETDIRGNYYVADMAEFAIRKYDSSGKFIRRIGRRGRGPGEFQDITSMTVYANRIFVFDNLSWRMTEFSLDGVLVNEYPIDNRNLAWPRSILFEGNRRILLSASERSPFVVHVLDSLFNPSENLIPIETIYGRNAISKEYMNLRPGSILSINRGVLYAPYFYSGNLFHQNFGSTVAKKIPGKSINGPPYSRLSDDATTYSIRYGGSMGFIKLRLHHESRGLFKYRDRIYHFIQFTEGNKRIFGYEIFDLQLVYQKFVTMNEKAITGTEIVDIPMNIKTIDSQGRVVVHNYIDQSIRIFQLPQ